MGAQRKLKRPAAASPKRAPKKPKDEVPEETKDVEPPAAEEEKSETEEKKDERVEQPEKPKKKQKPKKKPASEKGKTKQKKKKEKETKAKPKVKPLREQTKSWREQLTSSPPQESQQEGEEEEEKTDDNEEQCSKGEETRDFHKARKFNKMLNKGLIPAEVKKLYEDAAGNSPKPRLFRTQLINRLFSKTSKGEYVLSTGSNAFQSWMQSVDKKFATSEQVGTPYSVMLWQIFQGNTAAMADAEAKGDVYEKDGMWYHGRVTAGRTKENQQAMQLDAGKAKLSVDEYTDMQGHFMKRPWSQYGEAVADDVEAPALASGASSASGVAKQSSLKMLEDRAAVNKAEVIPWKKIESVVNDAKAANERLLRDTSRYVNKIRGSQDCKDLVDQVKDVMNKLTENLQKLQDCQCWQEIPGTNMEKTLINSYMSKVADQTDQCNEKLEQIKATCKARGLWAGNKKVQRSGSSGSRL